MRPDPAELGAYLATVAVARLVLGPSMPVLAIGSGLAVLALRTVKVPVGVLVPCSGSKSSELTLAVTRTLPVAVYNVLTFEQLAWGPLAAAAIIVTLPVLFLTIFIQREIVAGMTQGSVKGG